jgi:hypothetical protein
MRPLLALLPSAFLGPAAWEPVAHGLRAIGWAVANSVATGSVRTPDDVLNSYLAALPVDRDVVLVPHSNAGLFVPALAHQRRVVASVFVDAALPPEAGSVSLAPPALYELIAERADDHGLLPPWTQWWADEDVAALFPDSEVRHGVERQQPRVALSYLADRLDVPGGWADMPCAYLAFGDTYEDERADATGRGWAVRTLPGRHLHLLVDPPAVARAITELLGAAGISAAAPT